MKMNKYEQNLLQNCSRLDAVTNSNGNITNCAKAIIENKEEFSRLLCKFIERASELKEPQITQIAIATKDSLISFYGYQKLVSKFFQKQKLKKRILP